MASAGRTLTWAATCAVLTFLVVGSGAISDICREPLCEFNLTVRRSRTMQYSIFVPGWEIVQMVNVNQDGNLELVPTNYYRDVENGTIVDEDDVITADGVVRNVIVINDQFPGPVLEVMRGSQVVVHVTNNLLNEGFSVHWHGMHFRGTPWMDGTSKVTQCPILPQQTFTYRFKAEQVGTHFYHSHQNNQRVDGLSGMLIVHEQEPTIPEFGLMLQDWQHLEATALDLQNPFRQGRHGVGELLLPDANRGYSHDNIKTSEWVYTSGLINGRGRYQDNQAPLAKFSVQPGQRYRFRVVHSGIEYAYRVSVDQHWLWVVASDGHGFEPLPVESLVIFVGETYDFELVANQTVDRYWVRAESLRIAEHPYPVADGVVWEVRAILEYEQGVNFTYMSDPSSDKNKCWKEDPCIVFNCPFAGYPDYANTTCLSIADARSSEEPDQPILDAETDQLDELRLNFGFSYGSSVNSRQYLSPHVPFYQPEWTQSATPCDESACLTGCACTHVQELAFNRTLQLVLTNYREGQARGHHPVHLHGYSFYVLQVGYPQFNSTTGWQTASNDHVVCHDPVICSESTWAPGQPADLNRDRPPLKNTVVVPADGYVVVRLRSDNPGYWLLHCHASSHLAEGMAMVINVRDLNLWTTGHPPLPANFPKCGSFEFTAEEFESYFTGMSEQTTEVQKQEPTMCTTDDSLTGGVFLTNAEIILIVLACFIGGALFLFIGSIIKNKCLQKGKPKSAPITFKSARSLNGNGVQNVAFEVDRI